MFKVRDKAIQSGKDGEPKVKLFFNSFPHRIVVEIEQYGQNAGLKSRQDSFIQVLEAGIRSLGIR